MDEELDGPRASPPVLSPSTLPQAEIPEVSMVEAEDATGVTFTPELWMQRRHWALEVLRKEGVRSVLDIGCGTGALLETLVIPATTVYEASLRPPHPSKSSQLPSPVDSDNEEELPRELFIQRLTGLDINPAAIPSALAVMSPPSPTSSFPPPQTRWEAMQTEVWLGGIERYNSRLEGYEAITALEVIEHLDPNVLSRFGVVTMGTYRPRLLLVTTPNFDFNAKFPRAEESSHSKGFMDPTGRTERVFRHSDHKLEMTSGEFREWAEAAATDWGYDVELGGVGVSSKPSYYPPDDPFVPNQPIYATQTAVFRLESVPTRSPRSVRTTELPFMPGSRESKHPHQLAGKFAHPVTAPFAPTKSPEIVREVVTSRMASWNIVEVTMGELWAAQEISAACGGSKRYFVGCLGGWGDCPALGGAGGEFEVKQRRGRGLVVRTLNAEVEKDPPRETWGTAMEGVESSQGSSGGW